MTIDIKLQDTSTLLGIMREFQPVSNYWLNLCFPTTVTFEDESIDFEKLSSKRKLAPFVAPSTQGRPIYSEGGEVKRFKPAYVKPKDAVVAGRQMQRRAGELTAGTPMSPGARFNAVLADILRDHRDSIERRWEYLAAQAIINGAVTIVDEDYPERVVSFGRDAGHTVALSGLSRWDQSGANILGNLESWRSTVRRASFGGVTNTLTVGGDVWDVMRKDQTLLKQLDTNVRGTNANFNSGLREGTEVEYVGKLNGTLDVVVYSDYYQQSDGTTVPFMSAKDIVLTGPGVSGVRAFGAIQDKKAGLRAMPIFSKMWDQEDPSATFVMSQSAPLMVPVNPNCTFKATVLS